MARSGGDEFIVVHPEPADAPGDPLAPARLAERAFAAPFVTSVGETRVSASIGVAQERVDFRDPGDIIVHADAAMYRAKRLGRNRTIVYGPELHAQAVERRRIEGLLQHAIDDQRFLLHCQPVVDLTTGDPVGFESLVRMRDLDGRLVMPGEFVEVAEASGLVVPIGTWVLRESCRVVAEQRRRTGRPLEVSVNVSPLQTARDDFAETVLEALSEAGLPEQALVLELTESALLEAGRATLDQLLRLRRRGVHIALDDFGTGYSSLSYLRRLPVTCLKIDRSFVAGIVASAGDRAIVRAVLQLAGDLSLRWIAEGIETEQQRDLLAGLSSGYGQGYLFSRPVPVEDLDAALTPHRP